MDISTRKAQTSFKSYHAKNVSQAPGFAASRRPGCRAEYAGLDGAETFIMENMTKGKLSRCLPVDRPATIV